MNIHGLGAQTGFIVLLVVLIVVSACFIACGRRNRTPDTVFNVGPEEFSRRVSDMARSDGDIILLDVRTQAEYNEAHIAGSVLIPYPSRDFEARVEGLDPGKTYLLYCRSGNRSSSAAGVLSKLGYEKLYNLKGGINAWRASGLPVTTE